MFRNYLVRSHFGSDRDTATKQEFYQANLWLHIWFILFVLNVSLFAVLSIMHNHGVTTLFGIPVMLWSGIPITLSTVALFMSNRYGKKRLELLKQGLNEEVAYLEAHISASLEAEQATKH